MMLLSKYLLLSDQLNQCRFLVVTDRKDLQSQLRKNFKQSGAFGGSIGSKDADKAAVSTGKDLAQRIGKGNERILFTLIQKFNTAVREPNCSNDSPDLIVLVDEGHRTNSGQLHQQMKKALPNASFVAFTGTPLLKSEKVTTEEQFGPLVHAYTMQKATEDKTVVPLIYEDRPQDLDVNEEQLDEYFELMLKDLTEEQKIELKKRLKPKGMIYGADDRIKLIRRLITSFLEIL